jgi:dolichyl-phosphate-mannose-protein mannosyltransferase
MTALRRPELQRVFRGDRAPLAAIVVGSAALHALLAVPVRAPRIFGDELIYWELGRGLAWTGHFVARGGVTLHYGPLYPLFLAVSQRLGSDQVGAFAVAQALDAIVFSLAALPVYAVARRVLTRRTALLAALLAVVLPSAVYTSTTMTENTFYPLFCTSVWLMLRALERPSALRQLLVAAAVALTFLTRAQAVVLLPAYLVAGVLSLVLTSGTGWREAVRRHLPTIVVLAVAGAAALVVRGSTALGPYHVLVTSYSPRALVHWALANIADIELYVGVVPLAAFAIVLVLTIPPDRLSPELRRYVILFTCVAAGMLATVAVLGASPYGLDRVHERNIFDLVPFLLICFLAWLEADAPKPRPAALVAAAVVVGLPLTIPSFAIHHSGEDGIALEWWDELVRRPSAAKAGMVAMAAVLALVFLVTRRRSVLVAVCLAALGVVLVGAERRAVHDSRAYRAEWHDGGWIDRAVGPDANVVWLWTRSSTGAEVYSRIQGVWADEYFNRSVRDVASAAGPLPDGLPYRTLSVGPARCLDAHFDEPPEYAVVEADSALDAPLVATSPSGRAALYRLHARPGRCLVRLGRPPQA